MSSKANSTKKTSQQLKRNQKRKIGHEEMELSEKVVMKISSLSSRTLLQILSVLCIALCED